MSKDLLSRVLGRDASLFAEDIATHQSHLREIITGSRVLILGAAGSIGQAFVKQVVGYQPALLHLVDPSENNLVELVRDLRSSVLSVPEAFKTVAIDLGSSSFDHFLKAFGPYDHILNFAALKHVRSERDPYSLMRMLNVNVRFLDQLLAGLRDHPPQRFFSVSSDKAVRPQSLMGASKALMEKVLWDHSDRIHTTTARFANVAFSDGSLLHGFRYRLEKGQPLAAPNDVRRYFISHQEAGELCLLACFLGERRDILFPAQGEALPPGTFSEIAELFLESQGYRPRHFESAEAARAFAETRDPSSREWPCFFSPSDTTGEKPLEEFYEPGERIDLDRYRTIGVLHQPIFKEREALREALEVIAEINESTDWFIPALVEAVRLAVPGLQREEKAHDLDQKM
ncbi:MAG: polysaccharide biosynthesis protein [Magnetococcales bacterium]|nr:polysaccharide biosynthesis protein [Magnetococcales bacterium]